MSDMIKVPDTKIETKWVYVTPVIAKMYLTANQNNRNIRAKHVARLTQDMLEDRYVITHQGVAFDEDGVMIDGQHRCTAIVNSEQPQWMLVTTGLPSASKRLIDTGAARTAADFMPGKMKNVRSAGLRQLLAIERLGGVFSANALANSNQYITHAMVQKSWDRWGSKEGIEKLLNLANTAAKNVAAVGPSSLFTAAVLFPGTGEEFLKGLATMTGLEAGDPRLALLKYRGQPGSGRTQTPAACYAAVKCAKAFNERRKINVLRFSYAEIIKVQVPRGSGYDEDEEAS